MPYRGDDFRFLDLRVLAVRAEDDALTMKEAIVDKETSVSIIDSPIPKPGRGEVLIKVVVSGTNPKDWKVPAWTRQSANTGDDIAGIIEAVGEDVYGLHKGDCVAAFTSL